MDTFAPLLDNSKRLWSVIGGKYERNVEEIKRKACQLFAQRDDVNVRINSAEMMLPTDECMDWLNEVKQTEDEVNSVLEEIKENNKCLNGLCPNVYWQMKQMKRAEDILKNITILTNGLSSFEGRELRRVEHILPIGIEPNTSTHFTFLKIIECIREEGIQKIGIWGMGGVGKTRMMKLLIDHWEIAKMFNIIIWVTASRYPNTIAMQVKIANHLGLSLWNTPEDQSERVIYASLRTKKFLLLLDDVWDRIDLANLGIRELNEENGSKVILTTRSLDVCRRMGMDREIKIECLMEEESWRLFQEKVEIIMSPSIEDIARDVVKECGGLPIAINVVGARLRKEENIIVWRAALEGLRSPSTSPIEMVEELEKELCPFRFSYHLLQRNSEGVISRILLYCSLFPKDYEIKIYELVNYCWVEGFIGGADDIAKAQDIGHVIVKYLLDASLLERGKNEGYVKMHCVVRNLALRVTSITGGGLRFFVRAGIGLRDPPKEDEWEGPKRISLVMNELRSLPEMPNSSFLLTLMLQGNEALTAIPDSFFTNMTCLRVLDISGAVIESLPSSIQNLVSLRGLWLRNCVYLTSLPSQLGALHTLLVLDLSGTNMKCVPGEIGELRNLRRLVISFMKIKIIEDNDEGEKEREKIIKERFPVGMISRMTLLEELGMHMQDSDDWQQWDDASMDAVAVELSSLHRLTYLDFYFSKESGFELFVQENLSSREAQLNRFRLRIGSCKTERVFSDFEYTNEVEEGCLIYRGGAGSGLEHKAAMRKVLCHCSRFMLNAHHSLRKLSELGLRNIDGLEQCYVVNCDKMETLFESDEDGEIVPINEDGPILPNLKKLVLFHLPQLVSICQGISLDGISLKHVELNGCTKLTSAFSGDLIYRLCNLEELSVCNCPSIQEILVVNEDEMPVSQAPVLPKLKTLVLTKLPEMVDICRGVSLDWTALTHLELNGCTKLTSAFSGDILYRFSHLEMLSISSCPSMEELIVFGQVHHQFRIAPATVSLPGLMYIEVYESPELPNLKYLQLQDLPELLQFYPGAPLPWPSLKEIDIKHCQKLKSLSLDGSSAPNLERIHGETQWWQELEWKDNDIKQRFQPLFLPISE